MDAQAEQTLKQAVLRYNTKTTHCLATKKRFTVVGCLSKLEAKRRKSDHGAVDIAIHTADGTKFVEGQATADDFEAWVQAFHSFSGVTQQLMNADGTELFEVGLFNRWLSDVSGSPEAEGEDE